MIPLRTVVLLCLIYGNTASILAGESSSSLRAPAVPLVVCDPYFSVWSPSERLVDSLTMHWTGQTQALASMIRVDGQPWRLMGLGRHRGPTFPTPSKSAQQPFFPRAPRTVSRPAASQCD